MYLIILRQMVVMAIYAGIGCVLRKAGLLTKEGNRCVSNLLLYVILPCVIVNSFLRPNDAETTKALVIALGIGILLVAVAMALSTLCFRKEPVDNFSSSFSNAGFMGIPLIAATLGSQYVLYTAAFVAIVNILQWTYGQHIMSETGEKVRFSVKKLVLNPLVIALLAGLLLYFLPITIPDITTSCITMIAGCNAPVAMIILGYYLCELPFKKFFSLPAAYGVCAVRLTAIPLASILVLALIPGLSVEIKSAMLICAAAPVGSNVAIYAERNGQDYSRAVIMVCLSTIFSIVSMPLMILLLTLICR